MENDVLQKNVAIVYPPRSGGTTKAIEMAVELARKGILYLNTKHTAVAHAVRIFATSYEGLNIYHLAGTELYNNKQRIRDIHYKIEDAKSTYTTPRELNEYISLLNSITDYRQQLRELGLVGLQFELADDNANVICTVPHIAIKMPDYLLNKYDTVILDEDLTLLFFTPKSQTLVQYTRGKGKFTIECKLEALSNSIPDYIRENYKELVDWLNSVLTVINEYPEYVQLYKNKNKSTPEKRAMKYIKTKLRIDCKPPYVDLPIKDKIAIAEDLLSRTHSSEEQYEAVALLVASLFYLQYDAKTTQEGGRIYLITNEFALLFRNWLSHFKNIVVRVNSEDVVERFFGQLQRSYETLRQDTFKYKDNFTLFRTDALEYTERIYDYGVPALHVTARKKDAEKLKKTLRQNGVKAEIAYSDTSLEEINEWICHGMHVITYCNSSLSRGVDLPQLDVCVVWSTYFSAPFYKLLSSTFKNESHYKDFVNAELQQTVLRIAPIIRHKETQPKFIVFDNKLKDLPYFRYLHNDVINVNADYLAKITKLICPKIEKKIETASIDVLEAIDVSENYAHKYINLSYNIRPADKYFELFKLLMLTCPYKLRKTTISKQADPIKFVEMYNVVAGKTYSSMTDLNKALQDVYGDAVVYKTFVKVLEHLGLLVKEREGNRVKCTIVSIEDPEKLTLLTPVVC